MQSMTPFEPLPPPRPIRPSRARRALEIWGINVALVLLSPAGGIAYVLATGKRERPQAAALHRSRGLRGPSLISLQSDQRPSSNPRVVSRRAAHPKSQNTR